MNDTMKKILTVLLALVTLCTYAADNKDKRNDSKYLKGAVPEVEGKVVFQKTFNTPGKSKDSLYDIMLAWSEKQVKLRKPINSRVAYSNKEKGEIAVTGEEYMVFRSTALSLDRTRIYYLLQVICKDNSVDLSMSRIHYLYDENRDGGQKLTAENTISDEACLNKSGTKMIRMLSKFRIHTIDLKNKIFNSAARTLGVAKKKVVKKIVYEEEEEEDGQEEE